MVLGVMLAFVLEPGTGMNIDQSWLDACAMSAYTERVREVTNGTDIS